MCVLFVSKSTVCLYQYIFLLKSFTLCRNYNYVSIICWSSAERNCNLFLGKKKEYFIRWSLGVFIKWTDQPAQLRSNLSSYIKLKFLYVVFFFSVIHTCTYEALYNWHICLIMFVVILKDLNLALMHEFLSICELCWSQFICCH